MNKTKDNVLPQHNYVGGVRQQTQVGGVPVSKSSRTSKNSSSNNCMLSSAKQISALNIEFSRT